MSKPRDKAMKQMMKPFDKGLKKEKKKKENLVKPLDDKYDPLIDPKITEEQRKVIRALETAMTSQLFRDAVAYLRTSQCRNAMRAAYAELSRNAAG